MFESILFLDEVILYLFHFTWNKHIYLYVQIVHHSVCR